MNINNFIGNIVKMPYANDTTLSYINEESDMYMKLYYSHITKTPKKSSLALNNEYCLCYNTQAVDFSKCTTCNFYQDNCKCNSNNRCIEYKIVCCLCFQEKLPFNTDNTVYCKCDFPDLLDCSKCLYCDKYEHGCDCLVGDYDKIIICCNCFNYHNSSQKRKNSDTYLKENKKYKIDNNYCECINREATLDLSECTNCKEYINNCKCLNKYIISNVFCCECTKEVLPELIDDEEEIINNKRSIIDNYGSNKKKKNNIQ